MSHPYFTPVQLFLRKDIDDIERGFNLMLKLRVFLLVSVCFLLLVTVTGFRIELLNDDIFLLKVEDGLSLSVFLTPADRREFLEYGAASSKVCLLVDGIQCDCYDGMLNEVNLLLRKGCFDALHPKIPISNEGAYVSLLLDNGRTQKSGTPSYIARFKHADKHSSEKITMVLPLHLDDLSRTAVLFSTLKNLSADTVHELIVLVPAHHEKLVCGAVNGLFESLDIKFPRRCIPETFLLPNNDQSIRFQGYAVQMALKLLVAKIVTSDFYLTLDADVICLHAELLKEVIVRSSREEIDSEARSVYRGVYHFEDASVHEAWWKGSARVLGIDQQRLEHWTHVENREVATNEHVNVGIGVTPAILSTYGSLLTLSEIMNEFSSENRLVVGTAAESTSLSSHWIVSWISSLGNPPHYLWTEYTLYRLALAKFEVFHDLHVQESLVSRVGKSNGVYLHCNNVWYADQWPWDAVAAKQNDSCLFSVVQSTTNIAASMVFSAVQGR